MKRTARVRFVARGFTLIEVMIALSLLALIMLGLVSALATFGRTATSLDARFERGDEARLVSEFLRDTLGRVPSGYTLQGSDGSALAMFEGDAHEVRWLGVMPARHGMGGLYQFRLFVLQDAVGPALALQSVPFVGGVRMPDWASVEARVLVGHVMAFDLAYTGEDEEIWQASWVGEKKVPHMVRLAIVTEHGPWPDLLARVRPAGGQGVKQVVIGGGVVR